MALKYVKGDLIQMFKENRFDYLLHQCNCFNSGTGFAGALFNEYPDAQPFGYVDPHYRLGTNGYCSTPNGIIVNMFAQFNPGSCTETGIDSFPFRLMALSQCLLEIHYLEGPLRIGMPLVASGLAAHKELKGTMTDLEYFKEVIASTVKRWLKHHHVTVVYL